MKRLLDEYESFAMTVLERDVKHADAMFVYLANAVQHIGIHHKGRTDIHPTISKRLFYFMQVF